MTQNRFINLLAGARESIWDFRFLVRKVKGYALGIKKKEEKRSLWLFRLGVAIRVRVSGSCRVKS